MRDVMELAEVLTGYRGRTLEEILHLFRESVVVHGDGRRVIELEIFEAKIGLPEGFFAKSIGREEAPAAPTTEASI
ncbi:hypothetical protein D3C87_935640 [compost metagenome]